MLEGNSLRTLKIAVVVMAVLIMVGTVAMAVAIANRVAGPSGSAGGPMRLVEPEGSRIAAIAASDGVVAVHITGGGVPDRVRFVPVRGHTGVELVPR
jgi:hypothetical protein